VVNGKATAELCLIQDTAKCRGSLCRLDEPRTASNEQKRNCALGCREKKKKEKEKERKKGEKKKERRKIKNELSIFRNCNFQFILTILLLNNENKI
jgi:hypothetical protein